VSQSGVRSAKSKVRKSLDTTVHNAKMSLWPSCTAKWALRKTLRVFRHVGGYRLLFLAAYRSSQRIYRC
jgi:hypothetical protein